MSEREVSEAYEQALSRSSFGTRDVREAVNGLSNEQRDRLVEKLRRAKDARGMA